MSVHVAKHSLRFAEAIEHNFFLQTFAMKRCVCKCNCDYFACMWKMAQLRTKTQENAVSHSFMRAPSAQVALFISGVVLSIYTLALASIPDSHPALHCLQYGKQRKAGREPKI